MKAAFAGIGLIVLLSVAIVGLAASCRPPGAAAEAPPPPPPAWIHRSTQADSGYWVYTWKHVKTGRCFVSTGVQPLTETAPEVCE